MKHTVSHRLALGGALAFLTLTNSFAQTWQTVDSLQYVTGKAAAAGGMTFDPFGNLFVAGVGRDAANNDHSLVIASVDSGASWSGTLDDFLYPGAPRSAYIDIVSDASGTLYAAGHSLGVTNRWYVRSSHDHGLSWSTIDDFSMGGATTAPYGMTVDPAGNVYVAGTVTLAQSATTY